MINATTEISASTQSTENASNRDNATTNQTLIAALIQADLDSRSIQGIEPVIKLEDIKAGDTVVKVVRESSGGYYLAVKVQEVSDNASQLALIGPTTRADYNRAGKIGMQGSCSGICLTRYDVQEKRAFIIHN